MLRGEISGKEKNRLDRFCRNKNSFTRLTFFHNDFKQPIGSVDELQTIYKKNV